MKGIERNGVKRRVILYLFTSSILTVCLMGNVARAEEEPDVETIEVAASGRGTIAEEGISQARKAAIGDALKLAVEQAKGVMVSSSSEVNNFVLVRDEVVSKCEGYVKNYRIVEEKRLDADKVYRVSIVANVALGSPEVKRRITFDEEAAKVKVPGLRAEAWALILKTNQLARLIRSGDIQGLKEGGSKGLLPRYRSLIQVLNSLQLPEERMPRLVILKKGVTLKARATANFKRFVETRNQRVLRKAYRLNREGTMVLLKLRKSRD